ncbi:GntR family transcriptional regulator [Sporomusa acidovorans]|uniref:D-xylose utilization operon transcriptional repressor n=1 Tax=Sporomusa acidovorans (strain ATCC 49682 / DSM 3132 / Mol) TaxID=1123286 RepID=A0ABZ3JBA4_SPOA4|nr:GntR family transcriptional regulator [Sporomusa acidovorans]OZC21615.1 Glc operon transcriptional activator [Sporomusa acidovorans DSM 3132]SDD62781.1 DNA-binding transcriptional regulator, GntR family [Sporomusa acidovorans]
MFKLSQETSKPHKKTLTKVAYQKILDMIIDDEIASGEILSENVLADLLGMSRTPIREALRMLQKDDLIEVVQGSGTFVKRVTEKELSDLFSVRISLECLAVEKAIHYIDYQQIDKMIAQWEAMKRNINITDIDWKQVVSLDNELHRMIIYKSHNNILKHIYNLLNSKILRYQRLAAKSLGNLEVTIFQHIELLMLLKGKDSKLICASLEKHLIQSMEYIMKNM